MMVTKGRYQTVHDKKTPSMWKFWVKDTEAAPSAWVICTTHTEQLADRVADAMNFNNKPSEYGYKLVD